MKPILLLLFLAGIIPAQAQSEGSAKIYGYSEPVSKGVAPQKTIDENGKESTAENKQAFNFFIYLVSQSRVYPSEMWILGKPYSVSIERITKTPVVRKNYNNPSDPTSVEMVPETSGQVIRLIPAPAIQEKLSDKGEALSKNNELVVVYKQNGKFQYNILSELTVLKVVALQ